MILKGKNLGFTLTEIRDLIGGKGAIEMTDLEDQIDPQQIVTQSATWSGNATRSREPSRGSRATQSRLAQGAAPELGESLNSKALDQRIKRFRRRERAWPGGIDSPTM